MIDSHCHLADEAFAADLDAGRRSRARGRPRARARHPRGRQRRRRRRRRDRIDALWPDVRFAIGVHPHQAHQFADDPAARRGRRRASSSTATPSARAVGEIGLDYHYDFSPRDVQQAVFRAQVRLARELAAARSSSTRARPTTTRSRSSATRAAGDVARRAALLHRQPTRSPTPGWRSGFYISFAGIVTFPKAGALRETARRVPLDRLLTETDSPFLAPVPHRGQAQRAGATSRGWSQTLADAARHRRRTSLRQPHGGELPHACSGRDKVLPEPLWKNRRSPSRRSSSRSAPTSRRSTTNSPPRPVAGRADPARSASTSRRAAASGCARRCC